MQPVKVARVTDGAKPSSPAAWRAARPSSPTAICQLTDGARVSPRTRQRSAARKAGTWALSETCIRRPVLTTLITASLHRVRRLRLSAACRWRRFPPSTSRPSPITATLPGASAETMAASVAAPIERQLSTIAGITFDDIDAPRWASTQIIVQFDLNRNIDGAALDVQTALTVAQRRLPVEMTTPPSFRKVNPGDFPILYISLMSPTLPLSTVDEYGEITLAQQISQLPGVAQVLVYGAQKFAVRVQVDPVARRSAQHLAR